LIHRCFTILLFLSTVFLPYAANAASEDDTRPSFDVVRIDRAGIAVLAGRGPADAEIQILSGQQPLTKTYSSRDGEWVVILDGALAPGNHELNLIARLNNGVVREAAHILLILVPPITGLQSHKVERDISSKPKKAVETEMKADDISETSEAAEDDKKSSEAKVKEAPGPVALLLAKKPGGASRLLQKPEPAKGLSHYELAIDKIEFDEHGEFNLSGAAAAASFVRIYLNNKLVAEEKVGDNSRWSASMRGRLDQKTQYLRIDQIEIDGFVEARIEVPFSPQIFSAEMLVKLDERAATDASFNKATGVKIAVKPGENLWQIAKRDKHGRTKYTIVYQANKSQIRDPEKVFSGQIQSAVNP